MFAKLIDNKLEKAPNTIVLGNYKIINPTSEEYNEVGYYEVRDEFPETSPRKWYHFKKQYELKENYIRGYYIEEKDDCPDYAEEVNKRIREIYSQSAVEAIILNGSDTEEHAKELADLQAFRAKVKADVKADIDEWQEA